MQLGVFGQIIAALAGVKNLLKTFVQKKEFRSATPAREKKVRRNDQDRGPCAKHFRSYRVRYTNIFSRRAAQKALIHDAGELFRRGDAAAGERAMDRAATFPW